MQGLLSWCRIRTASSILFVVMLVVIAVVTVVISLLLLLLVARLIVVPPSSRLSFDASRWLPFLMPIPAIIKVGDFSLSIRSTFVVPALEVV